MSESYHVVQLPLFTDSPSSSRGRRARKTCNHRTKQSGIYEIVHIESGRIYIGSAVCFSCRWSGHKGALAANRHGNHYLQAAWNKYGADAFCARLIEPCPIPLLIEREQYWLDSTGCTNRLIGFNIALHAESMLGFQHSEVSKKKISQAKSNPSEATRELIRQANLGRKRPEADCIKISKGSASRRLTREQVIEIQERYEASKHLISQTQLAKEYRVATRTISSVVRREFPRYQTNVPFSGESTRKMSGMASMSPERRKHTAELAWQKRKAGKNG